MFGHDGNHHDEDEGHHDDQGQQIAPADGADGGQHGGNHNDQGHGGQDNGGHDGSGGQSDHGSGQGDGSSDDGAWQQSGESTGDGSEGGDIGSQDEGSDDQPQQISDIVPGSGHDDDSVPPMPVPPRNLTDDNNGDSKLPHELIDIKQKALGQLSPLMGQLELGPEDKFRTLMMMIQANDDQDLLKQAYQAADAIEDEKVRAQALLDIVNEITYFTQHPQA